MHPRFHERVLCSGIRHAHPRQISRLLALDDQALGGTGTGWAEARRPPDVSEYKGAHEAEANKGLFIPARTGLGDVQTHATCQRNRPQPTT